jgi:REP element-mobilizing transposase RayT
MRIARYTVPGAVHHVISRFVDRRWFFQNDGDRARYLEWLAAALEYASWRCLAYAIMSSHIHLVMLASEEPPESWSKRVNSPFGRWVNKRDGGIGAVYAGRAAMYVVPDNRVPHVIAYVHNNPVRAGVTGRAADSTWTSHRAYIGRDPAPSWLAIGDGLARCGFTDEERPIFDTWIDSEQMTPSQVDPVLLAALGKTPRRLGGVELGTPHHARRIHAPVLERPQSWVQPAPQLVFAVIEKVLGVKRVELVGRWPLRHLPRRVALLAARAVGLTITDVAAWLGITPQSGSRLLKLPTTPDERALVEAIRLRVLSESEKG